MSATTERAQRREALRDAIAALDARDEEWLEALRRLREGYHPHPSPDLEPLDGSVSCRGYRA